MDRVPNPYIHPSAWRNCLENSRKRLSAPLWWQEAPELGLLPPLLAALGAPIRDLSRISKQFRKGNSQKFARGNCGWHHAVSERGSSEEDTFYEHLPYQGSLGYRRFQRGRPGRPHRG